MTDNTPVKPHLEIHVNPVKNAGFSHYEIQTVREYCDASGEHYFEIYNDASVGCDEFAAGDVLYGVYGRSREGGAQWLLDCRCLKDAQDVLAGMIGSETTRKEREVRDHLVRSIISDIEAMRCDCPSYDLNEVSNEGDLEHWFGGFSLGHYDDEDATTYIQWPNLGIMINNLKPLAKD